MTNNDIKTLSQWAKDPRCPIKRMTLFNAIQSGYLNASMPKGCKMWLVSWSDLETYLQGK